MLVCVFSSLAWTQERPATAPAEFSAPTIAQQRLTLPPGARAGVIYLEGEVTNYTRDDLAGRMRRVRAAGAEVIVLDIDTYGGAVTSALDISHAIKQSPIPVVAFVETKAISAGALIAAACDAIYMAPSTLIGDCAPIMAGQGGIQTLGETERAKAESPILAEFRDSARRNGYSPLLLESMVSLGKEVYWIQKSGQRQFVEGAAYEKLAKEGWTPVLPDRNPLDPKEGLLTLDNTIAQQVGLSRGTLASAEAMARSAGWQIAIVLHRTAGDRLVAFLSSPSVTFALMTILSIAIYVVLHAPGHGFAEVVVVTCLAVLLGVPLLTGYAEWWEVLCVLVGVLLLALELFVIPGFGITGIAGITLIVLGLTMTLVPPLPPGLPGVVPAFELTWRPVMRALALVTGAFAAALVVCYFLSRHLPSLPLGRRLVLTATVGGTLGGPAKAPAPGQDEAWIRVGTCGIAGTDLRPGGQVLFRDPAINADRPVDVCCDTGLVRAGTRVIVHELRGQEVVVRPA